MNLKQHFESLLIKKIRRAERALRESKSIDVFIKKEEDDDFSIQSWMRESITLIDEIMKKDNIYYIEFMKLFRNEINWDTLEEAVSILEDLKNLIKKQELLKAQILIETEVFDSFLSQAEYLLNKGFLIPAAVIAGCVLEDMLKKMHRRRYPESENKVKSLSDLNNRLKAAGEYNEITHASLDVVIKTRNAAAHYEEGQKITFSHRDAYGSIETVKNFIKDHFTVQSAGKNNPS